MGRRTMAVLTAVVMLVLLVPESICAKKVETAARKEDVKYIKCQVCERIATQLQQQVQKKQAQISPKKISEYQIIEIAENVCNLKKEEADWITRIDIVEKGDKLELVEQEEEGMCNAECKTIEKACQEVMGYSDTDVAEYMYSSKPQLDQLVNHLCKDLSGACSKKPPPVPKNRIPGEAFAPKPSKQAEMDKLMRSMEGMPGAPGMKMYSREELMNNMNIGNEDGDNEDDDEDEEQSKSFPKNLGNIMREKEKKAKQGDWKQKITKQVASTGETLKKHAQRVSNRVRQWWKGMKDGQAKKKTSKAGKSEL
ncbi:unnamed protein product [Linum tenue]|uniref:Saposin B-type domain-containing protein n=1 Tax=Linum tenue TaxID=586396 RepID=A0AAV0S7B6_9ROSI|nr:unnamed protein product [Linum tenue]